MSLWEFIIESVLIAIQAIAGLLVLNTALIIVLHLCDMIHSLITRGNDEGDDR